MRKYSILTMDFPSSHPVEVQAKEAEDMYCPTTQETGVEYMMEDQLDADGEKKMVKLLVKVAMDAEVEMDQEIVTLNGPAPSVTSKLSL